MQQVQGGIDSKRKGVEHLIEWKANIVINDVKEGADRDLTPIMAKEYEVILARGLSAGLQGRKGGKSQRHSEKAVRITYHDFLIFSVKFAFPEPLGEQLATGEARSCQLLKRIPH